MTFSYLSHQQTLNQQSLVALYLCHLIFHIPGHILVYYSDTSAPILQVSNVPFPSDTMYLLTTLKACDISSLVKTTAYIIQH